MKRSPRTRRTGHLMTFLSRGLHSLQSAFYHDPTCLSYPKQNRQLGRVITTASREKSSIFFRKLEFTLRWRPIKHNFRIEGSTDGQKIVNFTFQVWSDRSCYRCHIHWPPSCQGGCHKKRLISSSASKMIIQSAINWKLAAEEEALDNEMFSSIIISPSP